MLGPSGAGKSTLLRVIAGLQTPSAGEVRCSGATSAASRARARAVAPRPDRLPRPERELRRLARSPVAEAIALPLALRGASRRSSVRASTSCSTRRASRDRAGAFPAELSGGERQRVALCVALAHGPALLLADEPTGELDAASAEAVRALIAELARAHGATAILVSHDHATAAVADRALRIRDGRVVEDRRDGEDALVVGRGGWVRLPPELLESRRNRRACARPASRARAWC